MSYKTKCNACGAEFDVNLPACPECGSGDRFVAVPESANFGDKTDKKTFSHKSSGFKKIELAETIAMIETLVIDSRSYMSVQLLLAASLYCRESWNIELDGNKELASADRYFAIGAVMLSFAAIDSSINEFYQDIKDNVQSTTLSSILNVNKKELLIAYWDNRANKDILNKYRRNNTLTKYQYALHTAEQPKFNDDNNISNEPFKRFLNLRTLRDAITHYHPETSNNLQKHGKIEENFRNYNMQLNPFFDGLANTFFPDKCFGHGLAEWSINTAIDFVDSFYERLNIPSRLNAHRNDFKTRG